MSRTDHHTSRDKKILNCSKLVELRHMVDPDAKIVQCHGVFDVLHAGHLAYLESAKKYGDILVVTVTADQFVNKGPGRPYFSGSIRANMLAALEIVDYVAISTFPTAVHAIRELRPHVYVKGPDYRDKASDPSGAIFEEERAAEESGGKLVFTEDDTHSSSTLINNFFQCWSEDQSATIKEIKSAGGAEVIDSLLRQVSKLKITVIGEPIVDTYVFSKPEAISSKSPSISARYLYQEDYAGGAIAIANHLADFVGEVTLVMTHGDEPWFKELLASKVDSRVQIEAIKIPETVTPRKTRFIADDKVQRLFELTNIKTDQWVLHSPDKFLLHIRRNTANTDCTIISDFGHGLIEGKVLEEVSNIKGFLALNVQTNSSNFGFNPFTKHKNYSYLSIDLKEARIAFQDNTSAHLPLAFKVHNYCKPINASMSMTLGPKGAYYLPAKAKNEIKSPAFTDGNIVDAVGAGDAFFALTSLLTKVNAPDIFVPFLGNVFAGLKTKIIGNKSAVSKLQLIKSVTSILK